MDSKQRGFLARVHPASIADLEGNLCSVLFGLPCRECVRLVKELDLPVEHIVLPTFAYEHKIFLGPFSRAFPQAKVWIAPR